MSCVHAVSLFQATEMPTSRDYTCIRVVAVASLLSVQRAPKTWRATYICIGLTNAILQSLASNMSN